LQVPPNKVFWSTAPLASNLVFDSEIVDAMEAVIMGSINTILKFVKTSKGEAFNASIV